jgi:cytidine deaminase
MSNALGDTDRDLVEAATQVIARNFREPLHTVGAAVLAESGKIYLGVDIETVGYGPCAEPIALGAAISAGERRFRTIVAARPNGSILPPCGNCRQLLLHCAPEIEVILERDGALVKESIGTLLPAAYVRPGGIGSGRG